MTRALDPSCRYEPPPACKNATEATSTELQEKPRQAPGVLYAHPRGVEVGRFFPSADVAPFVEHYWWVRWDLKEPRTTEVLSYPCVHVVFEADGARVMGVVRAKFSRYLEGAGSVCAIKFQPGMFRLLEGVPAWRLTDRVVPLGGVLGRGADGLRDELRAMTSERDRAALLERTLRAVLPPVTSEAALARDLVNRARADHDLRHAGQLAAVSGLTLRALQRLFRAYVGVGPKWVVRRFRLQEAAELLKNGSGTVVSVAASLGYFDQAHFVHDFKAVVGASPREYVRRARAAK